MTITVTPSIETNPEDGTKITLVNLDNVFIELQDESGLAGLPRVFKFRSASWN